MKKYFDYWLSQQGTPISGGSVTVQTPGGVNASLYDVNGNSVANPVTTSSTGYFEFYAPNGLYNLLLTKVGVGSVTITNVLLEDPAIASVAALRAAGVPTTANAFISMLGTSTPGDGVGGDFYWNSTSVDPDDGNNTILPTGYAGNGRWKRVTISIPALLTATGDTIYASSPGTMARNPIGNFGQVSSVNAASTGFSYWAPRGHISGLVLSNDGTNPNTTIDISVGECTDSTNVGILKLTSGITKTTSGWSAGTGNGGLDTGIISNSTWYHIYLIRKDSDGSIDALISASATSPSMPAGYTYKRRIGSVRTDASSHLIPFSQRGDEFIWPTLVADVNDSTLSTSRKTYTLTVPTGIKVNALFRAYITNASASVATIITSPDESDQSPSGPGTDDLIVPANAQYQAGRFNVRTNTSAQICARANLSSTTFTVGTYGWIDTRGRLD